MDTNINTNWSDLGLSEKMLELIAEAGYKHPSPVQEKTIPFALKGLDVLVSSQTGSGKTASFVIPSVDRFKEKNGTYILALSPTREIAQQTGEVFASFAKPFGMKVAVCIGGANMNDEKEALATSPHIIVATPGRLCDHLERGNIWLDFIQCLIFDEADRMLEMGFAKQIDLITEQIPKERQTLMLSATFAPAVEKLARRAMNNPEQVVIEKTKQTAPKIDQELFWIPEERKLGQLLRILEREKGTVFVFVNSKEKTFQLSRLLINKGVTDVTYIHSDLQQEHRELAVSDFKSGKFRIIIATDVMGRGIDVDDVAHVVNYDVPKEAADYIHRIGRTGRRGQTGHASTFAIPGKDDKAIEAISKLRGKAAPPKPGSGQRNDRGPRDNRGPRNNRGPRPERQRTQPAKVQQPSPIAPMTQSIPKETPVVKKIGLLEKIKKFFSRS
ncbi:DEAD/DEAH box helicase [Peredibacter starrii]|uniref:DEAD/DEAH box helicase n=1 Tax=Peredibacter starrii TaxID=28202 RepID=A0AAX4HT82_9BACT|nr:DEAD/DEAH box helicase [Peredibacter starrii]WPU66595.1 DEAD/DEAH box helicase [Peredibacter starrii]